MSKMAAPAPEENVVINVVPLVDIMFLLLLFLMIGGDMSHREWTELQLPLADKAQTADRTANKEDRYVVINIHPVKDALTEEQRQEPWFRDPANWQFAISGIEYPDFWTLVDGTATAPGLKTISETQKEPQPVPGTNPPKYLSAVKVSIRADKDSPYGMIQQAMQACATADLYKIEVGAAQPAPAR